MGCRILDLAESPARLRVELERLVVERPGQAPAFVPLADIAVVVASNPQISLSHAVLTGLAAHGAAFVACNDKHHPTGLMLPLDGHFIQARIFAVQARLKAPIRKRLWKQIVRAKIAAQAELLEALHGDDFGLRALSPLVRSGDPANVEARAASRYWTRLFGDGGFRRDREAGDQNALLNYGYAVLRAAAARAVVAAGLHPSIGLHHHNKYNAFCLADDLMESFRPRVDRVVADRAHSCAETELIPATKRALVDSLLRPCRLSGEARSPFDALAKVARSLVEVLEGTRTQLSLPERIFHDAEVGV